MCATAHGFPSYIFPNNNNGSIYHDELLGLVFHYVQTVDDDGEGSVASYVACCAEGIHSDVEGDHERLSFWTEAQNASQWSQCRHHRSGLQNVRYQQLPALPIRR